MRASSVLLLLGVLFLAVAAAGFGFATFAEGSETGRAIVAGFSIWGGGLGGLLLLAGGVVRLLGRGGGPSAEPGAAPDRGGR